MFVASQCGNIIGSITHRKPRIFIQLLDFCKLCVPLRKCLSSVDMRSAELRKTNKNGNEIIELLIISAFNGRKYECTLWTG
jgi:hypothetical protein